MSDTDELASDSKQNCDEIMATIYEEKHLGSHRTVTSIVQRWVTMLSSFRYWLILCSDKLTFNSHISDWMSGRFVGSTGQGPWWDLSPKDQKIFLGSRKAYIHANYRIVCLRNCSKQSASIWTRITMLTHLLFLTQMTTIATRMVMLF